MGIDRIWRKIAIKELVKHKPSHILDVATGTGESPQARLLAQTSAAQSVQVGRLPANILALLAD